MPKITKLPYIFKVLGAPEPLPATELRPPFVASEVPRARLLAHWLAHCCLYYAMNKSVLTDREFDELAQTLATYWDDPQVQAHPHAYLVATEDGQALTKSGFYITNFPSTVRGCAEWLLKQTTNKRRTKQ